VDLGPLLHPVGPHDPGVYWRRRLILLLVVVVVIIAIVAATSGGGGDTATVAQQPPPSSHPPTSGPSPSASAGPAHVTTGTPAPTTSAAGATPAACSVDALQLQAKTDQEPYPAGVEPKLTLVVTNPGPAPCRTDLGSSQLELRVLSGTDRVWSSDDCAPDGAAEPSVLQPGQPWAASLTWSRTRSAPTCPSGEPKADPGTYRLYARLGNRLSAPAVFHLT
jgi:hypothetical protein